MKLAAVAMVVLVLVVGACARGWRHEPFWSVHANQQEGLAVGSGGPGAHTFGTLVYDGWGGTIGGRFVGTTTELGPLTQEVLRGTRAAAGAGGEVAASNERIRALTEQLRHLEADLAASAAERSQALESLAAIRTTLEAGAVQISKLRVELASAQDWRGVVTDWGLWGLLAVLLVVGFFGWLIAKNWPRKGKGK